ncbi:MAG: hypothetical protein GYA33_02970 [Thermogutta sp.]|nr:hypothetical protein [Thermogutta sp.]
MTVLPFTAVARNLLLGQTRFPLEQLHQEFQRRGGRPVDVAALLWIAAAVIAVIAVTAVIARIVNVVRDGKPYRSSPLLFLSLCRTHGLSWSESVHLWRLAKRRGLRPAAQIFLSPEAFSEPQNGDGSEMRECPADRLFPREVCELSPVGVAAIGAEAAHPPTEAGPRLRRG